VRVEHLNVVHDDDEATVAHYADLYGGVVVFDRFQPTWHAYLMAVGGALFEIFVPIEFFLHTRYGPHFLGVEYHVTDLAPARETLAAHGVRIARELDVALHTHPADCHGVSLELFEDSFHTNVDLLDRPLPPTTYWHDHPLGFTGLLGYTVAVVDLEAARARFGALLEHVVVGEAGRPHLGAAAVQLLVGGAGLELVAPDGPGTIEDHLRAHGEGIRSAVFGVRDLDAVREHFGTRGIELEPGTEPGALAIPAARNRGVIFEFVET
jgi:hypothetical protein